jgi:hypothetical protein
MENRKWLKRKFPKSFEKINIFFDDEMLDTFKKGKYNIGKLSEDIIYVQKYKKDSLVIFKRSNSINSYSYPNIHAIVKCQKGFTTSGYHSIDLHEKNIIEILK